MYTAIKKLMEDSNPELFVGVLDVLEAVDRMLAKEEAQHGSLTLDAAGDSVSGGTQLDAGLERGPTLLELFVDVIVR